MKKIISVLLVVVLLVITPSAVFASSETQFDSVAEQPFNVSANGSGYTYGPWFGGGTFTFGGEAGFLLDSLNLVMSVISQAVSMPYDILLNICGTIVDYAADCAYKDSLYGYIIKDYREVYINGQFAYFQTRWKTYSFTDSSWSTPVGNNPVIEYYEGDILMRSGELTA